MPGRSRPHAALSRLLWSANVPRREDALQHSGGLADLDEVAIGVAQIAAELGLASMGSVRNRGPWWWRLPRRRRYRRPRVINADRGSPGSGGARDFGLVGCGPPPGFLMIQVLATFRMPGPRPAPPLRQNVSVKSRERRRRARSESASGPVPASVPVACLGSPSLSSPSRNVSWEACINTRLPVVLSVGPAPERHLQRD